jgi:uncharacterized alkaline shock family protein YloU
VSAEAGPRGAVPAESRGSTEVADRAVARIARQALTEVDDAAPAPHRPLGALWRGRPAADVSAWVDGSLAVVNMRVSVVYPAPVREVTQRLREHVRAVVGRLTGLDVRQVDIEVARLVPPERPGGRVV